LPAVSIDFDCQRGHLKSRGMATAAAVNEGRNELLGWISELLQMSVTRIEHIGTGAVLCHIVDSIYGDVPLHKVKFNASHEYEYVNNFKILQAAFTRHKVDKVNRASLGASYLPSSLSPWIVSSS